MMDDPRTLSIAKLLTGVVQDARDLFAAHVQALRNDVAEGIVDTKRALVSWAIVVICAGLTLQLWVATGIAVLVDVGLSLWLACACAAGFTTLITVLFVAKAYVAGRKVAKVVASANQDVADGAEDARWAVSRTAGTLTESSDRSLTAARLP